MKVIWLPQATEQLRITAKYIHQNFGSNVKDNFLQAVRQTNLLLSQQPNLGKAEPLLSDRAKMYRSTVVNKLNKIIYFIADDHIEVADFWDCRREPEALVSNVK